MPTADGSGNGCTCDCDQCETPTMEQWYHSYSDHSSSGHSSDSEDSGDKEYEALQTLIRSGHDSTAPVEPTSTQAGDNRRSESADLSALGNITIISLQGVAPQGQQSSSQPQVEPKCQCKLHAGGCTNLCESAETAEYLHFKCNKCIQDCESSICICCAHVVLEEVENRRSGLGSCSKQAAPESVWSNNCRPSVAQL